VIANFVTASRIALAVPLYGFLTADGDAMRWAALGVLVLAGLTDVVDGRIARALNQVSALGAMLDLIADRLLTATLVIALIGGRALDGIWAAAALVLLCRDLVVASFGEASHGRAKFPVEKVKVALQFTGFGLLIVPVVVPGVPQHDLGRWAVGASAVLALFTLAGYSRLAKQSLSRP
jgi:cardiolipin synthase